ncbi:transposase, IS4 [Rhodococcus gordoniae]|uniref:Transposase, IS4 n=1 Tax=Rhodococcus gordoniae TaxID=223392 RepID=A0A379PQY0_9NOCA|nr:transposase, IS4 [Rhodococcus gordoniae]
MPSKGAAVHADLEHSVLAHLSFRIFNANAAWLVLVVIAFNLTRAAGTVEAPELARTTTATLRRKLVNVGRTVYGTEATVADMSMTTAVVCRVFGRHPATRDGPRVASRCRSLPRWMPGIRVDRRASGLTGAMTADRWFVPTGRARTNPRGVFIGGDGRVAFAVHANNQTDSEHKSAYR